MRFEDIKKLNTGIGCTIEDYIFIYGLITLLKPKTIIEIGTNTGVSSIVMASALKENNIKGKIFTYDISNNCLTIAKKQIKNAGLENYINPLFGTSNCAKKLDLKFDFAFIDGDHSYEGVKRDFENLKNKCEYILFHDVNNTGTVKRFIKELQGEKLSLLTNSQGTVYNMGKFITFTQSPGFALWKKGE